MCWELLWCSEFHFQLRPQILPNASWTHSMPWQRTQHLPCVWLARGMKWERPAIMGTHQQCGAGLDLDVRLSVTVSCSGTRICNWTARWSRQISRESLFITKPLVVTWVHDICLCVYDWTNLIIERNEQERKAWKVWQISLTSWSDFPFPFATSSPCKREYATLVTPFNSVHKWMSWGSSSTWYQILSLTKSSSPELICNCF